MEIKRDFYLFTGDSFRKVVVRKDVGRRWFDESGVLNISVYDFLLDPSAI